MNRYTVEITTTMHTSIVVEAANREDAEAQVRAKMVKADWQEPQVSETRIRVESASKSRG